MLAMLNHARAADTVISAPPHIQHAIANARLAGEGRFRWFGLSIYDAQLWVGDKGYQTSTPDAASYALDLRYARAFEGAKIAESSIDQMRKIGSGSEADYGPWLTQMKAIFPNVVEGSHITGVFLPGIGARFYFNGKTVGEIADPKFAQAFFGIWLSPKTTDASLRKKLLTDAAPTTAPAPTSTATPRQ
ncbi:hypothetical protein C7W93_20675 [Glaciimonas sp. PCH181]|nr:hypothetical protein C7W93_20675 [Glaciimonas sp. PCH181]